MSSANSRTKRVHLHMARRETKKEEGRERSTRTHGGGETTGNAALGRSSGGDAVRPAGGDAVRPAEQGEEHAVLEEPARTAARVDHGPSFLAWPLDLGPPNSSSSILALPLQRLGRRWPRALRLCLLPAALLAVAAHATADATVYHQNLLLQFSRKLSWLGSCLAPPCRGPRPTPALCAPSRGYDAPLRATACHGPPTRCAPCVAADAALPTLFSQSASQRACGGRRNHRRRGRTPK